MIGLYREQQDTLHIVSKFITEISQLIDHVTGEKIRVIARRVSYSELLDLWELQAGVWVTQRPSNSVPVAWFAGGQRGLGIMYIGSKSHRILAD